MRVSEQRLREDMGHLKNDTFVESCKIKPNHFTRKRKMPLNDLLLSMLNRKGLTLFMELRRFHKILKKESTISKVGYLKQRMKLNPKVFMNVNDFHMTNFYHKAENIKKKNRYLVLAVDAQV